MISNVEPMRLGAGRRQRRRAWVSPAMAKGRGKLAVATPRRVRRGVKVAPKPAVSERREESIVEFQGRREGYDGNTALHLYLREVGSVKLLTAAEEIQIAARVRRGNAKAREHMIKANLRLVVKIAKEYEGMGLPLLDLISEGNIGLMCAVERFDPRKGARLATYGSWWIKQSMRRALANQSKTIRLPVHIVDRLCRMRRTAGKLHEDLGREPTDEELAVEMGLTVRQIGEMQASSMRPMSLDAPLGEGDAGKLADLVADENATNPGDELESKAGIESMMGLLADMDPREASVLRFRYGLNGGPECTLEEVGDKFGVTRERARQLQLSALRKLRKRFERLSAVRKAA